MRPATRRLLSEIMKMLGIALVALTTVMLGVLACDWFLNWLYPIEH